MLKKDKNRILLKLDEMQKYINDLKEMLPTSEDEYVENKIIRRACEKTIELAIESLIDVCSMIISVEKLDLPKDEDTIFDILVKNKIIDLALSSKLNEIKGFRNVIVHKYGDVDDSLSYEFLSNELDDFDKFYDLIKKKLS